MPIISILSCKGGAGASLIACNLALALGKDSPGLLVDLHVTQGADDLLLGISSERTWADLLHVASELSNEHLHKTAAKHHQGFSVLTAPSSLRGPIRKGDLEAVLTSLRDLYPWVVIDVQSGGNTLSASAMRVSTHILFVTTLDPPSLRTTHRMLNSLSDVAKANSGLIVNQFTGDNPISPESVSASLGVPLLAVIPSDQEAIRDQVFFGDPASGSFSQSVTSLAMRIAPVPQERRLQ